MAELSVTWIAPVVEALPQLAWLNELGRIEKIVCVRVVSRTGSVLRDDVAAILQQPTDVLIWSGHGAPAGLLLSDGSLVRPKWLAAQISRGCRPRVVILAACSSQERDESLRSLTEAICRSGINVIGFPAQAGDVAAGTFTIEYVRALSVNTSVAQAFDVAMESIAEEVTAQGVFLTPGIVDLPFNLELDLRGMREALDRIERQLNMHSENPAPSTTAGLGSQARTTGGGSLGGIQPLTRAAPGHIRGINDKKT